MFEWLERKIAIRTIRNLDELVIWTKDKVNKLKNVKNHWSRAVDFWYMRIIEGFIVEFVVELFVSFNEAERKFLQGLHGKYIDSISLWIKLMLCKKGVISIESDTMDG